MDNNVGMNSACLAKAFVHFDHQNVLHSMNCTWFCTCVQNPSLAFHLSYYHQLTKMSGLQRKYALYRSTQWAKPQVHQRNWSPRYSGRRFNFEEDWGCKSLILQSTNSLLTTYNTMNLQPWKHYYLKSRFHYYF